jgi:hypothetical protein
MMHYGKQNLHHHEKIGQFVDCKTFICSQSGGYMQMLNARQIIRTQFLIRRLTFGITTNISGPFLGQPQTPMLKS